MTTPQATHAAPHWAVLESGTQTPEQSWNPAVQVTVQAVPLHAVVALATDGHIVQLGPHWATESFATHAPEHR
jgi:hypothetical protein